MKSRYDTRRVCGGRTLGGHTSRRREKGGWTKGMASMPEALISPGPGEAEFPTAQPIPAPQPAARQHAEVVHTETILVTREYVPGADLQADAVIEAALEAARSGNPWTNRFRVPQGTRISSAIRGG